MTPWTPECSRAVSKAKEAFLKSKALVHYNPKLPLKLICDTLPVVVGAQLVHTMPSGEDRPIAFVSRALTKAKLGYAQFDREALSIIFGVKRFFQ